MVPGEPTSEDNVYEMDSFRLIINKEEEKEVSFLEIDYVNDWSGEEFIITAGF